MSRYSELCSIEPRLAELHKEALEVAAWSGGNTNQARDLWYGRQNRPGVRTKMMQLLRDPTVPVELKDRSAYHEVYDGLLNAILSIKD
jgi:hypothetical protein